MNNNRKNFILGILTGIFLCVAVWAAWFYLPSALSQKSPQELTIDQTVRRINRKEFKEALFKESQVEFIDIYDGKWITTVDSDVSRRALLQEVSDFNAENPSAVIKTTESSGSTGQGWVFLIQFFPLILLGLLTIAAASLAILAYKALFNKRVEK